jgi:hypothetical protein
MVAPLILLATGVLFSWLLAEPFAMWMQQTMPFHADYILARHPVESLISIHTVLTVSTLMVLSITVIGLIVGWRAARSEEKGTFATWPSRSTDRIDSIFNGSAGALTNAVRGSARIIQKTQTGQLNWNIAGIVLGLIALLLLILQGVL